MSHVKLTPTQARLQQEMQAHVDALKNDPACTVADIGDWLGRNMNRASKVFTGRAGRAVGHFHTHSWRVDVHQHKPILLVYSSWRYESYKGERPNLETVSKFIPDVSIATDTALTFDTTFAAELGFDLTTWRNLVPVVLAVYLRSALADENKNTAGKEKAVENVKWLLRWFYPSITYAFLEISVDLGVLAGDDRAFVAWFNEHVNRQSTVSLDAPCDLLV